MPVTHKGLPVTPTHKGLPAQVWHKGVLVSEPDIPGEYETPAFVQVSNQSTSVNAPSRTVTGTAGNTLVAVMRANTSEGGAVPTITTPGWTAIAAYEGGQGVSTCIAVKEATGAAETVQGSFVAGTSGRMVVLEFSGVDLAKAVAGPVTTVDPGTSVTTLTASGLVAAEPSLLLGMFAASGTSGTVTTDPAITMHWDNTVGSRLVQPGTYDQTWSWDTGRRARVAVVALAAKGDAEPPPPDPEPEPEFIAVSASDGSSSSIGHQVTIPSEVTEGDLLVLTAVSNHNTAMLVGPPGWNERYNDETAGAAGGMWTKAATASEAAGGTVTVNTSIAARCAAVLTVYRDLSIEEGVMDGGSDYAVPSVTAAADDWAILAWLAKSGDMTDLDPPAGVTERHTFAGSGAGHLNTLHGDVADLTAGATPTYTATPVGGASSNIFTGIVRAKPSLTGNDEEPPPPPPNEMTMFGVTADGFPNEPIAFGTSVGHANRCIRIYTGGSNSTGVILQSPNPTTNPFATRGMGPDCNILASYRFAEDPSILDSYIIGRLQVLEQAAAMLNPGVHVWFTMNPEPDRSVRRQSYSTAEFRSMHGRVFNLAQTHAPSVRWALNLTGYLFASRVGDYIGNGVIDQVEALWTDPYWLVGETHQGNEAETLEAVDWCAANNKRFAIGEWGVEKKDGLPSNEDGKPARPYDPTWQAEQIGFATAFINNLSGPSCDFAPYFQNDTAGPWRTRLDGVGSDGSIAAYSAALDLAYAE